MNESTVTTIWHEQFHEIDIGRSINQCLSSRAYPDDDSTVTAMWQKQLHEIDMGRSINQFIKRR